MGTELQTATAAGPLSGASFLRPQSIEEAWRVAKYIAESDLAPKDYQGKPQNAIIAVMMGAEVGLAPMQAIQNIAVINGRPSLWGDAMLALVRNHPEFESISETFDDASMTAKCVIKRRGNEAHTVKFSKEDATKAGLWGKQGPWTHYAKRMLQLRARGFCCRDTFPDALRGLSSAEESRDLPVDITAQTTRTDPKPTRTERMKSHLSDAKEQNGADPEPVAEPAATPEATVLPGKSDPVEIARGILKEAAAKTPALESLENAWFSREVQDLRKSADAGQRKHMVNIKDQLKRELTGEEKPAPKKGAAKAPAHPGGQLPANHADRLAAGGTYANAFLELSKALAATNAAKPQELSKAWEANEADWSDEIKSEDDFNALLEMRDALYAQAAAKGFPQQGK